MDRDTPDAQAAPANADTPDRAAREEAAHVAPRAFLHVEPVAFDRTLRTLRRDSFATHAAFAIVWTALLGGWCAWLTLARIGVYETTDRVRLEVDAQRRGRAPPDDQPRAIGLFPVTSIGRIRVGQPARVRVDGFPWPRYGALSATVSGVGDEPEDGRLRVVLALGGQAPPDIPLAHGLTASAEVEVERTTPLQLILRILGARAAGSPAAGSMTRLEATPRR